MIQTLDFRVKGEKESLALPRAIINIEEVSAQVKEVILDVKNRGDEAVVFWNEKFPGHHA